MKIAVSGSMRRHLIHKKGEGPKNPTHKHCARAEEAAVPTATPTTFPSAVWPLAKAEPYIPSVCSVTSPLLYRRTLTVHPPSTSTGLPENPPRLKWETNMATSSSCVVVSSERSGKLIGSETVLASTCPIRPFKRTWVVSAAGRGGTGCSRARARALRFQLLHSTVAGSVPHLGETFVSVL